MKQEYFYGANGDNGVKRGSHCQASRYFNKVAMIGCKGGLCSNPECRKRPTYKSIRDFEFDHKKQLNTQSGDLRWSGVQDWVPFTEEWFAWADTVDLFCHDCHIRRHKPVKPQMSFDEYLRVQRRLDAAADDGVVVDNVVPIK